SRKFSQRSSVDLPQPEGPIIDTRAFSPCLESRLGLPARHRDVIPGSPGSTGGVHDRVVSWQGLFAGPARSGSIGGWGWVWAGSWEVWGQRLLRCEGATTP